MIGFGDLREKDTFIQQRINRWFNKISVSFELTLILLLNLYVHDILGVSLFLELEF